MIPTFRRRESEAKGRSDGVATRVTLSEAVTEETKANRRVHAYSHAFLLRALEAEDAQQLFVEHDHACSRATVSDTLLAGWVEELLLKPCGNHKHGHIARRG